MLFLEVKSPPRCRMCIRHLCLFSAKGCVWIGFTEYLRNHEQHDAPRSCRVAWVHVFGMFG